MGKRSGDGGGMKGPEVRRRLVVKYGPLSESDIATLARALDLEQQHQAGIFAPNGGQVRHLSKLATRGFLEFEGHGHDIDGMVDREVPIWRLTDLGRELARAEVSLADAKADA